MAKKTTIIVTENSDEDLKKVEKMNRMMEREKKLNKKFKEKQEYFDQLDPNATIFANADYITALIGYTDDGRAVYDYDKMIEFLIEFEDMSTLDAMEWIDYNTKRALPYMGELAPIIINMIP
jgi:hypothetical protein